MPHFFINSKDAQNGVITVLRGENYHHIKNSLRLKEHEPLNFVDENKILYETIIQKIDSDKITAKVHKLYKSERFLKWNIFLAQSVLKTDAQNYVVQKASELGIKGIYPLVTDNCVVKKSVVNVKIPKWQKIADEAAKQCERCDLLKVFDPEPLEGLVKKFDYVVVFAEKYSNSTLKQFFSKNRIKEKDSILIVIGPEGGFSEKEFEFFYQNNLNKVTLGSLILKADTAAIAGLSNVIYEISDYEENN